MTKVVTEREVVCKSAPEGLWPLISDTNELNRIVGMDRIELTPISDGTSARYLVTTRMPGGVVEFEERPYEWVYPRRFEVLRKMRSGAFESLELTFALSPLPEGGSSVSIRLTVVPRAASTVPFVRLAAGQTLAAMEQAILAMDMKATGAGDAPRSRPRVVVDEEALTRAASVLAQGPEAPIGERLVALVREAEDADVARIRPFALADAWGEDRRAVLAACLRAVRAGLLELRWEIICPSCRNPTESLPSLASLAEHGGCQLCELSFALDLEQAVEATFAPVRSVRATDVGLFCIGGPARVPHVLAQAILPAAGEALLACPHAPGSYRLFIRGGAAARVDVGDEGAAEARVSAADPGGGGPIQVAPGGVVRVDNPSGEERHAKIERVVYADTAAKAQIVTTMPGFRRDFSSDILRPGTALKVSRVGLFFSDLTGSTQLYSNAGDAAAFKLVHDHFDVVFQLIETHGGGLVKTIGDAVMAVFSDDLAGLAASVAILHAFEDFVRKDAIRSQTHIKLGVFGGPCYVVTANGILDYFGQTVNIAARLQGEARSGELVVEEDLAERAAAKRIVTAEQIFERYEARLKGVDQPLRVARIRVATPR
jgi:adenylate cyclase